MTTYEVVPALKLFCARHAVTPDGFRKIMLDVYNAGPRPMTMNGRQLQCHFCKDMSMGRSKGQKYFIHVDDCSYMRICDILEKRYTEPETSWCVSAIHLTASRYVLQKKQNRKMNVQ